MEIREIVAYNLRRLRKLRKWTLEQVAEKYGCEPSYISQLERNAVSLGPEPANKLARIYEVDKKEFIRVPPEIGDAEMDRIWQSFYAIQQGEKAKIFSKVVDLFEKVNSGKLSSKAIEGLKNYLDTFLES
jgi:transcriptional regulator with XRE-family HTH domain